MFLDILTLSLAVIIVLRLFLAPMGRSFWQTSLVKEVVATLLIVVYFLSLVYLMLSEKGLLSYLLIFLTLLLFLPIVRSFGSERLFILALSALVLVVLASAANISVLAEPAAVLAFVFLVMGFVDEVIFKTDDS